MSRPETDKTVPEDRRVDLLLNLGAQKYAIEHTRIGLSKNEIRNNIRFTRRYDYIKKRISDSLPGPAYYVLEIPVDFRLPPDRKQRERELDELVEWIQLSAPICKRWWRAASNRREARTGLLSASQSHSLNLVAILIYYACRMRLLRVANPGLLVSGQSTRMTMTRIYCIPNDCSRRLPTSVRSSINTKRMTFEPS